jgi:hypothetical protein
MASLQHGELPNPKVRELLQRPPSDPRNQLEGKIDNKKQVKWLLFPSFPPLGQFFFGLSFNLTKVMSVDVWIQWKMNQ